MELFNTDFMNIEKEYISDDSLFSEDSEVITILNELTVDERRLLILYAELKSFQKVAKMFRVSKKTIYDRICVIRTYFKQRLGHE